MFKTTAMNSLLNLLDNRNNTIFITARSRNIMDRHGAKSRSSLIITIICLCTQISLGIGQTLSPDPFYSHQQQRLDSLHTLLRVQESRNDTNSAKILAEVSAQYSEFDSHKAVAIAELAERLTRAIPTSPLRMNVLNILGYVYRTDSRYDDAIRCFAQAMALAKAAGINKEIAEAYLGLGFVVGYQGRYDVELSNYLEAMPYAERSGSRRTHIMALLRVATGTHIALKNYTRADSLYSEALRRCIIPEDDDIRGIIYNSRGNFYDAIHYPELQLKDYRLSLACFVKLGYTRSIGRTSSNLGWTHFKFARYDSTFFYFNQCISLYEKTKYVGGLGNIWGRMALVQNTVGQFQEAIMSAKRALFYATPIGDKPEQLVAFESLTESYTSLGEYKKALEANKKVIAFRDSMYNESVAKKIATLEAKQKEQQIALLQSENLRQKLVGNFLIGGLVALLVLTLWFVRLYTQKRSANHEIIRQQQILEAQATEIELANALLQEQNVKLKELDIEKNEFLGIAAHDLKNPLSNIFGLAEMLLSFDEGMTDQQRSQFLSSIVVSSERMFELIKNLLDINAIEQRGLDLHPVTLNVNVMLSETVKQFIPRASAKQIRLNYTNTEPVEVFADERALSQVMDNLVSNALKYSPSGTTVQVFSKVHIKSGDLPVCQIYVKDEGPGINDADQQKLFTKFARLSALPTGGEHSTGLGLSIVKKLVEAMKGKVWCESELGSGATFVIELPASQ